MSSNRLLVVIGSGPGIGVQTAAKFASEGFDKIALVSRNAERLKTDKESVAKAGSAQVKTYPVDVGDGKALKSTLAEIEKDFGSPEVVLFNAARVAMSGLEEPFEDVIEDCKVMQVGLYITGAWAAALLTGSHPSFLLSASGIFEYPLPSHVSLSMQKAGQVNFLKALAQIVGPKGIHVARVDINGVVQDSDSVINAKNIAKQLFELSQQDKNGWETVRTVGSFG